MKAKTLKLGDGKILSVLTDAEGIDSPIDHPSFKAFYERDSAWSVCYMKDAKTFGEDGWTELEA